MSQGKKMKAASAKVDRNKFYGLEDALKILKTAAQRAQV
jgi:ribosomal protein L1